MSFGNQLHPLLEGLGRHFAIDEHDAGPAVSRPAEKLRSGGNARHELERKERLADSGFADDEPP